MGAGALCNFPRRQADRQLKLVALYRRHWPARPISCGNGAQSLLAPARAIIGTTTISEKTAPRGLLSPANARSCEAHYF
jgi:hypothetical protein